MPWSSFLVNHQNYLYTIKKNMRLPVWLMFYLMVSLQVVGNKKLTLALAATAVDNVGDGWVLLMDKPEGIEFNGK